MTCRTYGAPGGPTIIVCTRGERRKLCCVCNKPGADRMCDQKIIGGTCDREMHAACVTVKLGEEDFCPKHAGLARKRSERNHK